MRLAAITLSLALAGVAASSPEEIQGPPRALKGLKVHEWGVFLVGPAGGRSSCGGEPPSFIQRVRVPAIAPPPVPDPPSADKPVVHVYAPGPMSLGIRVGFPGGRPLLAWPRAEAFQAPPSCPEGSQIPSLSWELSVGGKEGPSPPQVPADHWLGRARAVGSDRVVSADGKDAERFVFYEGEVAMKPALKAVRLDGNPVDRVWSLRSDTLREAWLLDVPEEGGKPDVRWVRAELSGGQRQVTAERGDPRPPLERALTGAGLSPAEAQAVLDTWMPALSRPGTRVVHLMSREEYDRVLPIEIRPEPGELVRVGLAVQEVSP